MHRIALLIFPIAWMQAQSGPLHLSMKRAVELALSVEGSAKMQIAREFVVQAQARSTQAKSALLPNVEISAGAQNLTRNLAVLGLTTATLGFPIPERVGPLSVADARATAGQAILDLSSVYRYRASKVDVLASDLDVDAAAEQVAAEVAQAYLAALRCAARVEASAATLQFAKSALEAVSNQRSAGSATGLEVARASLRVADEEQKLLQARIEQRRSEMSLRRAVGLRMGVELELTDQLGKRGTAPSAAEGIAGALRDRPDWKAQAERERRAGLSVNSARAESLPSVKAFADYGATGSSPLNALGTYTAGVAVQFPLFDGGRRRARAQESASQMRQETVRTSDLRDQIKFDIEVACDQIRSAAELIAVAETARATAERSLEQVQRRYKEGIAAHLQVDEAQTEVARARDNEIAAFYASNAAWIDFYRATGSLRREIAGR